jgi:hypothetical protein
MHSQTTPSIEDENRGKDVLRLRSSSVSMTKEAGVDTSKTQQQREKKLRARVLPRNLMKIDGKSIDIDFRGFPADLQFTLGGKKGNVVCSSKIPTVLKSWRVVAVNGKHHLIGKTLDTEIMSARQKSRKFTITFSFGEVDDDEEEES